MELQLVLGCLLTNRVEWSELDFLSGGGGGAYQPSRVQSSSRETNSLILLIKRYSSKEFHSDGKV
jgi:hypothetical protein